MGLTKRNEPQSFEEMAEAEEREVKSEPVVKKENWFQRFFKKW